MPLTPLLAGVLRIRHLLYDLGWLRSYDPPVPAIVIGNLALGGTGKTPLCIEVLERLRAKGITCALLSRGYGRRTSGYLLAGSESGADRIGDEPALIRRVLPWVPVAVCEDRVLGIRRLLGDVPGLQAVVLDDAFQHRRLRPTFSLLLTTWQCPFPDDRLWPAGRLRDLKSAATRAQCVIVTRCPAPPGPTESRNWRSRLRLHAGQLLAFSTLRYEQPVRLDGAPGPVEPGADVAAFCGLADPSGFRQWVSDRYRLRYFHAFPDHHPFTPGDIRMLESEMAKFARPGLVLLTTAKDAERLRMLEIPLPDIRVVPIRAHVEGEDWFNHLLAALA